VNPEFAHRKAAPSPVYTGRAFPKKIKRGLRVCEAEHSQDSSRAKNARDVNALGCATGGASVEARGFPEGGGAGEQEN
jgi:hypothetical protein